MRRLIECRDGQRLPQHFLQPRRLSPPREPFVHGPSGGVADARRRARARRGAQSAEHATEAQRRHAVAHAERRPPQQSRHQVQGRRKAGGPEPRSVTGAVDDLEVEPLIEPDVAVGADLAEKIEGLVIAAKQRVLPVVDHLARGRIRECGGSTAEAPPLLDNGHPRPLVHQANRGAQARKASAHDDDVRCGHHVPAAYAATRRRRAAPGEAASHARDSRRRRSRAARFATGGPGTRRP